MKRDMDLIRDLMLRVEAGDRTHPPGVDEAVVLYHKNLLLEARLASGNAIRGNDRIQVVALSGLTWEGHELLDNIRSDSVWSKAKEKVAESLPSASMDVLKATAAAMVAKMLGVG